MTLAEMIANANADPTFAGISSSNDFWYGSSTETRLTDAIATVAQAALDLDTDKAEANHTHTGYATADHTHTGFAAADHTHTGYAASNHTHDYADADHTHTPASIGAAPASHTHDYAASNHGHSYNDLSDKPTIPEAYTHPANHPASMITGLSTVATSGSYDDLSDKPTIPAAYTHPANHPASMITGLAAVATSGSYDDLSNKPTIPAAYTHPTSHPASMITGLATVATSGKYSDLSGTPTIPTIPSSLPANGGNADTVDGKHASDFATASHTHEYLPLDGGEIDGNLNVKGIIRANGQQAFYYASSTNSQTIGTNNATGGTNIACGPDATCNIGGAIQKTASVLPRNTNTFLLGNANFRWKGIYSTAAVNVSSDERLKRDISTMDGDALAAFINALQVKSYNYKDDAEDAKARIGLIAQDVQEADPLISEFFVDEGEDGMLNLRPADLVFPLIAAVQELSKRVAELEGK